jgi:hypothetical protein
MSKLQAHAANWAHLHTSRYDLGIMERRSKRSQVREEALQYLVEAVHDRSAVFAVAVVDEDGRIVAGTGMPRDVAGLARIAERTARGETSAEMDEVAGGLDVVARAIPFAETTDGEPRVARVFLAALGTRVRRMHEASAAILRICEGAASEYPTGCDLALA